jgi:hypothetical protein
VLVACGLGLLSVFCTSQAGNPYQSAPVGNNCFDGILAFKHLSGDGISLICDVFFCLMRGDDFVPMFIRLDRLAGMGRFQSQKSEFMLSTYPHTVLLQEL